MEAANELKRELKDRADMQKQFVEFAQKELDFVTKQSGIDSQALAEEQ